MDIEAKREMYRNKGNCVLALNDTALKYVDYRAFYYNLENIGIEAIVLTRLYDEDYLKVINVTHNSNGAIIKEIWKEIIGVGATGTIDEESEFWEIVMREIALTNIRDEELIECHSEPIEWINREYGNYYDPTGIVPKW